LGLGNLARSELKLTPLDMSPG